MWHWHSRKNRRSRSTLARAAAALIEDLESRQLLSAAFDITGINALRNDSGFAGIDGSGVGVAILDSGLWAAHPDLSSNFVAYFDAVANGRNAWTDPGDTHLADAADPSGHGTHVAGIAASSNPQIGVATHASLIGVRVLPAAGQAWPSFDPILAGLDWVIANHDRYNIKVVNLSLGDASTNLNSVPNLNDEGRAISLLEGMGVTVVAASGNSYAGFETPGATTPAVFSTLSVASTWEDSGTSADQSWIGLDDASGNGAYGVVDENPSADQLAAYSQRSTLPNQIAAPGSVIYSTWNDANGQLYNLQRGTSMAAALVSGAVALLQDAALTYGGRYLLPSEIQSILIGSADTITDSQNPYTQRVPLTEDASGRLVLAGPPQDIPETGLTFQRINVLRAVQTIKALMTSVQLGSDATNTMAKAVVAPVLDGSRIYTFRTKLGGDGLVNVGDRDIDLYKVTLLAPGFLSASLPAMTGITPFSANLILFDDQGSEIARISGTNADLETDPLPAGTYYLGISAGANSNYSALTGAPVISGGFTGDYVLMLALSSPDVDGTAASARYMDLTNPDTLDSVLNVPASSFSGEIGTDPDPLNPAGPAIATDSTDVDFYRVTAPDTGLLTIRTSAKATYGSSGADTLVRILDQDLNEIGSNDDSGNSTDSLLSVHVTAGQTYYIAITKSGNPFDPTDPFARVYLNDDGIGKYQVFLSFSNGDANGTARQFFNIGSNSTVTVTADIGADAVPLLSYPDNGGSKDVDFYGWMAPTSGFLDLGVSSVHMASALAVWQINSGGTDLVKLASASGDAPHLGLLVQAGQVYYISVTGAGNEDFHWWAAASGSGGDTGTYTLSLKDRPLSDYASLTNNSVSQNTPEDLALGTAITRSIGMDGSVLVGPADVDIYRFVAPASGPVVIHTDTTAEASADTVLRVFDSSGNEISYNDNASALGTASSITLNMVAGQTYYIGVNGASALARSYNAMSGQSASAGLGGTYGLVVQAVSGAVDAPEISISDITVEEPSNGTSAAHFAVTLSRPSDQTVTVQYQTSPGTAGEADFTSATGTITFAPGQTSAAIDVPILSDDLVEDAESFLLNLTSPTGGVLVRGQAICVINDGSDSPGVTISNAQATETDSGTKNLVFNVTLSKPATRILSVDYSTVFGTATEGDLLGVSGTLTFWPGQSAATILVPIVGDLVHEDTETFSVELSNPDHCTIARPFAVGTILDDDAPPAVSIADTQVHEGDDSPSVATFTITLSTPSGAPVTVHYATSAGTASTTDYANASGVVTIPAGEISATVQVLVNGDITPEPDEIFLVKLSSPQGATLGRAKATGLIIDNDGGQSSTLPAPTLSIADTSIVEGTGSQVSASFTVTLSQISTSDVSVQYTTISGSARAGEDFLSAAGILVIPAGERTGTILVPIVGDTASEASETFTIKLSLPSGATISRAVAVGTIEDDDPAIELGNFSITEGDGPTQVLATVTLSHPSDQPVTVDYSTLVGTATAADFTPTSGTITFAPGQTVQTIPLTIQGNTAFEPNKAFTIHLSNPAGAQLPDADATVTIVNDDADPNPHPDLRLMLVAGKKQTLLVSGQSKPISFASATSSRAGAARVFRVYNDGDAPLTLGKLSVPKGYRILDPLVKTLAPGKSDIVKIALAPGKVGARSGKVHFKTNTTFTPTFNLAATGKVLASKARKVRTFSVQPIRTH